MEQPFRIECSRVVCSDLSTAFLVNRERYAPGGSETCTYLFLASNERFGSGPLYVPQKEGRQRVSSRAQTPRFISNNVRGAGRLSQRFLIAA